MTFFVLKLDFRNTRLFCSENGQFGPEINHRSKHTILQPYQRAIKSTILFWKSDAPNTSYGLSKLATKTGLILKKHSLIAHAFIRQFGPKIDNIYVIILVLSKSYYQRATYMHLCCCYWRLRCDWSILELCRLFKVSSPASLPGREGGVWRVGDQWLKTIKLATTHQVQGRRVVRVYKLNNNH